ncbi:zinc-binding dehydrogenase [Sphingomonas sp. MMS24-J13]|uniref:zinc-binding dehydrogenase n=1 Tax=Sphingomonas sp. MMS24-J13 TaxID=3238686 RepID=UPI00384D596A
MKASGICGSDLHVYRGSGDAAAMGTGLSSSAPIIAGHEPAGIVRELGKGVRNGSFPVGSRVMVHHYWGCTTCDQCRTGWTQMCETKRADVYGVSQHGGHAPYLKVPAATLVHLPDELSFAGGAAVSCGTGTAFGALKRLNLSGDQSIAIFGQGPVGLAATQLATAMGAKVIAVDVNDARLAKARELGAAEIVNPMRDDPIEMIRQYTGGRGTTCALEAAGSPQARIQAIRAVKLWGTVAMVGAGGDVTIDVGRDLMLRQVSMFGSWTFSLVGQLDCARFAADRGIDLDAIFTDYWTLDQAEEAYARVDAQAAGKAVFLIN